MYYEEKVIDGKLMYRTRPSGEWSEVSYESLLSKYLQMKDKLRGQLQNCIDHLHHAKRNTWSKADFDKVIDSANRVLYETLK